MKKTTKKTTKKLKFETAKPIISSEENRLSSDLEQNIAWVEQYFFHCSDLIVRRFRIGEAVPCNAVLLYLDGMTDSAVVHDNILVPLMHPVLIDAAMSHKVSSDFFAFVHTQLLPSGETTIVHTMDETVQAMMNGDVVLLLDQSIQGLVIDAKGFPHRDLGEPRNEKTLRGPQEAFVEAMRVNTAMLRRRLHTGALKLEQMTIGTYTQTAVTIAYLEHIANDNIIDEVRRRLNNIKKVDSILNASCIEQYIEDRPFSIFPQVQYTERPDKTAAALLEGRVALIVDGSPDVILLPVLFTQLLQSSEDYYNRIVAGTFVRWVRYMGLFIATTLPSLYVAVISFHAELIPFNLLLSIATAREGVPFPAFVEAIMMEIAFELLREASIRMPGVIGNTIGIVGALVIGDAAVSARLVAPQMVIVVAITAIGSFAIPSVEASYPIRLIRFPLMILAATLGLYGVMLGWLVIIMYLIRLRTFGFPYLAPLAPLKNGELLALAVRMPRWCMMGMPLFCRQSTEQEQKASFFHRRIQPLTQKGDDSRGQQ
ncbi:MAG: spore germination protein [Peptococcaceae bacterium]|nr:spore germination protein [Peptococcaceae bacterium]